MGDLIAPATFTPEGLVDAIRAAGFTVVPFVSEQPMPTVPAAAEALGVAETAILKTLLFQDKAGNRVRVIASGPDRIDRKRIAELAGIGNPSMAPADVVLDVTGWPVGGVAPVGCRESVLTLIDERILAFDRVFGGGGTELTLIGLAPIDIVEITGGQLVNLHAV